MRRQEILSFTVHGKPVAQGSTRAFVVKGRPIITSTAKGLKSWRTLVSLTLQERIQEIGLEGRLPLEGPVFVSMRFRIPRPKSEPKNRRTWPDRRPDLDKLVRAVLDSLSGVAFSDDGQVVSIFAEEDWGLSGVTVWVGKVSEDGRGTD